MNGCPYFKKGYFGACTASRSPHIPSIAEMEQYCFREHFLCPIFEFSGMATEPSRRSGDTGYAGPSSQRC